MRFEGGDCGSDSAVESSRNPSTSCVTPMFVIEAACAQVRNQGNSLESSCMMPKTFSFDIGSTDS